MSQFSRYTINEHVEALRVFLGGNKKTFLRDAGFIPPGGAPRKGRLKRYDPNAVKALQAKVNAKAARCEASDTTLGERYQLARDYLATNDAEVARRMGVSRELVRRWASNAYKPASIPDLAAVLQVPETWLMEGGEKNLPASSHLGVRVGEEAEDWRERLFALTQSLLAEAPEEATEQYLQAFIEWSVFNRFELAQAARRAGGRWQVANGALLFAPWIPLPDHGLSRRKFSDEVENIIAEEMAKSPTVYGAYTKIRERCQAMGLSEDQYPKRISLHKRVETERERAEKFGVDLNDVVAASLAAYTKQ